MIGLSILVVDDEPRQREILAEILGDEGHDVRVAASVDEATAALRQRAFDLCLTDLRMPGRDGVALLEEARALQPEITVILMTAYATVASAVEAMKKGAHDYLQKPFSKDELVQRVQRVAERVRLVRENRRLREELSGQAPEILGESVATVQLRRLVDRLSGAPGDVLITGESGTGKELVARRIHFTGPRATGPFVAVNCAAIAESLAESELFGHEKGAFTHAIAARAGRFEQADGGTLFLDEIASMSQPLQAKLLRVLEDRMVERVGASRSLRVDVRLISATNQDLRSLVAEGKFREDLYHRLNVLEVRVPPLRERREDIPLLARVFRDRAALRYGVPAPEIEDELLAFLATYPFPGNIRELEHLVEKMVALSDGESIGIAELPPSVEVPAEWSAAAPISPAASTPGVSPSPASSMSSSAPASVSPSAPPTAARSAQGSVSPEAMLAGGSASLIEVERRLLREAIRLSGGNLTEAARRLGISYKTLRYRVRKFGIDGGR